MNDLAQGMRDVERGFAYLNRHPRLWGWVLAPAVITFLLLIALGIGISRLLTHGVAAVAVYLPSWVDGVVSWVLAIVLMISLVAGAVLVFVALAGVIAGPFCERLSESVETQLTGRRGPPFSIVRFVVDTVVALIHGLRRVVASVLAAILLFALSFLPIVGTVAVVLLGGWLAARGAAYDCYDAILSRRALAYRHKLEYLRKHHNRTFGLGVTIAVLLMVPGVNLLALGVGAVGATLAVHDLDFEAEERLRLSR
jgi:CysZ protein